jgi:hypothetical protein
MSWSMSGAYGPVWPKPEREVDDARVDRGQRLVVDAEALDHAGAEALDDDIRVLRERAEDGTGVVGLEIEAKAALVAAEGVVRLLALGVARLAAGAGGVAPPRALAHLLDQEHVGAEIAEQHRAVWPRRQAGEVEHRDPFERQHGGPPMSCRPGDHALLRDKARRR